MALESVWNLLSRPSSVAEPSGAQRAPLPPVQLLGWLQRTVGQGPFAQCKAMEGRKPEDLMFHLQGPTTERHVAARFECEERSLGALAKSASVSRSRGGNIFEGRLDVDNDGVGGGAAEAS